MGRLLVVAIAAAIGTFVVWAADWPMAAGGPQRTAWARSERLIEKSNVSQLQLLYKFKPENTSGGLNALTPPIVNGNLITYVGFKEMLIFGTRSNKVFSIDADVNKPIWVSTLAGESQPQTQISDTCPGGLTAPVIFAGSSSASRRFNAQRQTPTAPGTPPAPRRSPYFPPLEQTLYPLLPTTLTRLAALYAVSSDGSLHILNSSTGQDLLPAVRFVPPHSKVTSLNIQDNVVYATTGGNCDGFRNGLYALDLLSPDKKVTMFVLEEGGFSGAGGTTLGSDGTVYVQVLYRPDGATGKARHALVALAPKTLAVRDFFLEDDKGGAAKNAVNEPGISPLVFTFHGRDLLLAGGRTGRLYLLDSKSLGGADHHQPLYASEPIPKPDKKFAGYGFRGSFTSWLDFNDSSRWFYAPIFGPVDAKASGTMVSDKPVNGSVIALKLVEENDKPQLKPLWVSQDIPSPASPVSANGMVFVLSSGEPARLAKQNGKPYSASERAQMSAPAQLIVLDATTGKGLYSSGKVATAGSSNGGLAVANGRAYFTTDDNTVYCFGLLKGQSQLSEEH